MSVAELKNYETNTPPEYLNIHVNRLKSRLGIQIGANLPILVPPQLQTTQINTFLELNNQGLLGADFTGMGGNDGSAFQVYTKINKLVTIIFSPVTNGNEFWTAVANNELIIPFGGIIGNQIAADLPPLAKNNKYFSIHASTNAGAPIPAYMHFSRTTGELFFRRDDGNPWIVTDRIHSFQIVYNTSI